MTIQTMKSNQAHKAWGQLLENALKGIPTIIQRYSRNAAILVNYDEWKRMKEIEADRINTTIREMREGNYVSGEEIDRVLGT
ncbi:MAG: hypothetical protein AAF702_32010 [Chloroflexota bacterium]